jgi:hypothetical protein
MIEVYADMENYMGRGIKGEYDAAVDYVPGPVNKRERPCDTCPMMQQCLENVTDCKAMRHWYTAGNYKDADLIVRVKACA